MAHYNYINRYNNLIGNKKINILLYTFLYKTIWMHKQIAITIVAATIMTILVFAAIATLGQANAKNNKTGSGNMSQAKASASNATKSMTNTTMSAAKNATGPVVGAAGGAIGGAKSVSPSK